MSSRAIDVPPERGAADKVARPRPGAALVLEPVSHDSPVKPVVLLKAKYLVGSDPACGVHLPAEGVFPRHGEIRKKRKELVFKAYAGKAWLNNIPVDQATLFAGDRLSIGPIELRVREALADELLPRLSTPAEIEARPESPRTLLADETAHRAELMRESHELHHRLALAERTERALRDSQAELDCLRIALDAEREGLAEDRRHLARECERSRSERSLVQAEWDQVHAAKAVCERERQTLRAAAVRHEELAARLGDKDGALQRQVEQLTADRNVLRQDDERLAAGRADLATERLALEADCAAFQALLADGFEREAALARNETLVKQQSEYFALDREEFQQELEHFHADRAALAAERAALEIERAEFEAQIAKGAEREAELARNETSLKQSREQLACERNKLRPEQERLAQQQEQLALARTALAEERSQLDTERDVFRQDRKQLEVARATLAAQRSALETDSAALETLVADGSERKAALARNEALLEQLSEELAAGHAALCREKERLAAAHAALEEERSALEEDCAALQAMIAEGAEQQEAYAQSESLLKKQTEELAADREALCQDQVRLNEERALLARQRAALELECAALQDCDKRLRQRDDNLMREFSRLGDERRLLIRERHQLATEQKRMVADQNVSRAEAALPADESV